MLCGGLDGREGRGVDIVITEWALQSYLELKHAGVITRRDYWTQLRPDVELLHDFPGHPKFRSARFWGPATDKSGSVIPDGFKMKWRTLASGRVQLRLCVVIHGGEALLCQAYVKDSPAIDKREAAKLKSHLRYIIAGNYTRRGLL
jgi:hypothetical protein